MAVLAVCRAKEEPYIASMGIYVAKASAIRDLLLTHFPEVLSNYYFQCLGCAQCVMRRWTVGFLLTGTVRVTIPGHDWLPV